MLMEWQLFQQSLLQRTIKKDTKQLRSLVEGDEARNRTKHAEFMKIRIAIF